MNTDYEQLLIKYMAHILSVEGDDFLTKLHGLDFTEAEMIDLILIKQEAKKLI